MNLNPLTWPLAAQAAGVGVLALMVGGGSYAAVSATPSGHASAAGANPKATAPAKTATVGDYFDVKDERGDSYRVQLAKLIDPAQDANQLTPDNGTRYVGAVFTITALSAEPQNEDANDDAAVIGSNGQTYDSENFGIAGYTNFNEGQITVFRSETVIGAVEFQVPSSVKVTRVQWSTSADIGSTVQWSVP